MPHAEEIGFRLQGKTPYSLTQKQNQTVLFLQLELIPELKAAC
jgi:hypothetical protein